MRDPGNIKDAVEALGPKSVAEASKVVPWDMDDDKYTRVGLITDDVTVTDCRRCPTTGTASECCSSHNLALCHLCYRRTHFVEVCAADCPLCAAEGLPVRLSELPGGAR